ncbi:hypothetical protein HW090_02945 [Pseudomonas sp. ABC1]|uniref:secretin N-terminal domain-containing protein n=1 Tax=Pseudomonas sp. ABC1 TaxID=2748080 RepID=UPI0015C30DB5|nr:secretin N-terminal domain-containing protein [Pseudomonas sp. ABC1]QLF92215.1 hypothetical protein HW090_02945 [Pseudomonas sp. ABC1]
MRYLWLLLLCGSLTCTAADRVSLSNQDVDIRVAIPLLADFCGRSILLGPSVQGIVSLNFQDVECDAAIDMLLESNGLSSRYFGDVLMVTAMADSVAKDRESRNYELHHELSGEVIRQVLPVVHANASSVAELFRASYLNAADMPGLSIAVDERTNSIFAALPVTYIDSLRSVIAAVDVPVRQVVIEASIVEANTDWSKNLGVRWASSANLGNWSGSASTAVAAASASTLGGFGYLSSSLSLDLQLSAMESSGQGEIVSRPTVLTLDRETATILRGSEIPYQQSAGDGATSVQFKRAALQLSVTPAIAPDDAVVMHVSINRDMPDFGSAMNGVPPVSTNQLDAKIRIADGQTVVLGGVYTTNQQQGADDVPVLSKIPLMGRLFKRRAQSRERSELLIFLTPRVVPVEGASGRAVAASDPRMGLF